MAGTSSKYPELTPNFKKDTICKIIEHHFKDDKTKLSGISQELVLDLVKLFATEAITRCEKVSKVDSSDQVELKHLEAILPQLMLDF